MAAIDDGTITPSNGRKRKQRHQSSNGKEPQASASTPVKRPRPSRSECEMHDSLDESLPETMAIDQASEGVPLPMEVHHSKMRSLLTLLLRHQYTVNFEDSLTDEILSQAVAVNPPDVKELPCSAGVEHAVEDLRKSGQYPEQHLVGITMRLQAQLLQHMRKWQGILTKRIAANAGRLNALSGRSSQGGN